MKECIATTSAPASQGLSLDTGISSAGPAPIRIWLVDDNEDVRAPLAALLETQPDLVCERQFGTAEHAITALGKGPAPEVILLDINLGSQSGLDAIRPIKSVAPWTRVLMLTTFFDTNYEAQAREAGASGFLLKSYEVPHIVELIRAACTGEEGAGLFSSLALRRFPTPEAIPGGTLTASPRSASAARRPSLLRGLLSIFAL